MDVSTLELMLEKAHMENERLRKGMRALAESAVHDIKGPLGGAYGFAQLALEEIKEGNQNAALEYLERVMGQVRIVTEVMDAHLGRRKGEQSTDLAEFLKMLVFDAQTLTLIDDKKVKIDYELPSQFPENYEFDSAIVRQIIGNYLTNSLKFVPETGGTIKIGTKLEEGNLVFYVTDNGPGIAEKDQQRIFSLYGQTDTGKAKGGNGIGLYNCKKLAEDIGAVVGVESKQGNGSYTTMKVFVPYHSKDVTVNNELGLGYGKEQPQTLGDERSQKQRFVVCMPFGEERINYDPFLRALKAQADVTEAYSLSEALEALTGSRDQDIKAIVTGKEFPGERGEKISIEKLPGKLSDRIPQFNVPVYHLGKFPADTYGLNIQQGKQ